MTLSLSVNNLYVIRQLHKKVKRFTFYDMTLNEFRKQNNWSYSELARQLGATHATVARRWCLDFDDKNRLIPNVEYMSNIMLKTNGAVMPNDFYIER